MEYSADIEKIERRFVPKNFAIRTWAFLEPFFQALADRAILTEADLMQWLKDCSELEAVIAEDACWRQIAMTRDTSNKTLEKNFTYFCTEIQPHCQTYTDILNKKLIQSPFLASLDKSIFFPYIRQIAKSIEIYTEKNLPLFSALNILQQQYGVIAGKMSVRIDDKEYTLQQAAKFLENPDRNIRKAVYKKIQLRRWEDRAALNQLFDNLLEKRNQVARNAGYTNYREYKFDEMGRFDYSPETCFAFHEAIKKNVLPLVEKIYDQKKTALNLSVLHPWDLEYEGNELPLTPFENGEELLQKTINCLEQVHPFFSACLRKMAALQHFDLESRKGKAPGGYNCPLPESGAPFIFMNASRQMSDLSTMVHEAGHAVHSFLAHSLPLTALKVYPIEMAELASMGMELISMEYWAVFFEDKEQLQRAKIYQLIRVITIFPWIAMIDAFQHWIYTHPNHTETERTNQWLSLVANYMPKNIDFMGVEKYQSNSWQKQIHLFEFPFYYIEYGIAQLAAIQLWKNYKENSEKTLQQYLYALSLGGTKTLTELYQAAGIDFDLSPQKVNTLLQFVYAELSLLKTSCRS